MFSDYFARGLALFYGKEIYFSDLRLGLARVPLVAGAKILCRSYKQGLAGTFVAFATAAGLYWQPVFHCFFFEIWKQRGLVFQQMWTHEKN